MCKNLITAKYKIILLIISIFSITCINAQQHKIDSLRNLILNTKKDTAKIELYEKLGEVYSNEKKIDSSIICFKYALEINEKNNYSALRQCWNMGAIDYLLFVTGNYAESLNYASRALALTEKLKDTFQLGFVHLVFGHNYKALGDYRQSLNHYFKARQIFKLYYQSKKKPEDNTYTILCIGDLYLKINQPDSALLFVKEANKQAYVNSDWGYILYARRLLGDICLARGEVETALNYYRQYIPDFVKYNENNRDLSFVLVNVARILQKKGQLDSAIYYAKRALEHAVEYEDQENLFNAAKLLTDYYDGKDDHAALNYLKIATQAKDSMLSSDKLKQTQLISINEQVREKNKQEANAKEAARIKLLIYISAIIVCIITFLLWNRIRQLRLKHKMTLEQKEAEKLQKQILELEAKALRAQMNPHFIFNCMNSIKSLIQQDEKDKAITYFTTFSKLIRTIFDNSDKREITLFDEIETCRLYTQLEGMRVGDKLSYSFSVDETIDLKSIMVPALILQPFIENAIWHGIIPKEDGGEVNISISKKEDKISCMVEDNGIGREISMQNKFRGATETHQSKGLALTKARLELDNSLNERNASVEIIDKKNGNEPSEGTKVILRLNEY